MRARSASPSQTARCYHRGCRLPAVGQETLAEQAIFRGITAALRRERCGPAVTRQKPGSLRSADSAVTCR